VAGPERRLRQVCASMLSANSRGTSGTLGHAREEDAADACGYTTIKQSRNEWPGQIIRGCGGCVWYPTNKHLRNQWQALDPGLVLEPGNESHGEVVKARDGF